MRKLSPSLYIVLYILIASLIFIMTELHIYRKEILLLIVICSIIAAYIYSNLLAFLIVNNPTVIQRFIYGISNVLAVTFTVIIIIGISAGGWVVIHSSGHLLQNLWNIASSVWLIGLLTVISNIEFWILVCLSGFISIFVI